MSSITTSPEEILATILAEPLADVEAGRERLRVVGRMRNVLDGAEATALRFLDEVTSFPEAVVAEVQRTSVGMGAKLCERARTAAAMPELGAAMELGDLSGRHVDTVAKHTRGLDADQQVRFAEQAERIVHAAATQTAREYEATVKRIADHLRDDQIDKFERQRCGTRLRWWTDHGSGMVNVHGCFDPEQGARLIARLVAQRERMFHGGIPDTSPSDPGEREHHLNALALTAILTSDTRADTGTGPDISVLIDATTLEQGPHEHSVIEVSAGGVSFDVPADTIRRWACGAEVTPIVVAADGQRIWLGRTVRTANRAQRRAMRVLYATCALCETVFEHCEIHHVQWYRHGGRTDIDNLLPMCVRHHHLIHEGGWQLHLALDRTLTVAPPHGEVRVHGPPMVRAG